MAKPSGADAPRESKETAAASAAHAGIARLKTSPTENTSDVVCPETLAPCEECAEVCKITGERVFRRCADCAATYDPGVYPQECPECGKGRYRSAPG